MAESTDLIITITAVIIILLISIILIFKYGGGRKTIIILAFGFLFYQFGMDGNIAVFLVVLLIYFEVYLKLSQNFRKTRI